MLTFLVIYGVATMGQFDPNSPTSTPPANFSNIETSGGVVCASCSGAEYTQTFTITAVDDGTDLDKAYFEWVVFGGRITANSGSPVSSVGPTIFDSNNYHYVTLQGVDGSGNSTIEVTFDEELPAEVWVAVRQSSEFGCNDGDWSVFIMENDQTDPYPTFTDFDTWTDSLVVVLPASSLPVNISLGSFDDNVHSSRDAIGTASTVNVDPAPNDDDCALDLVKTTITAADDYDATYFAGEHDLVSEMYDCQGNDSIYTQRLFVYDASEFSVSFPSDSIYALDDCSPSSFDEETGRLNITLPVDENWTVRSIDATGLSGENGTGCIRNVVRDYVVTAQHKNNHNTYDFSCQRTYYYSVSATGPEVVTKDIDVYLDGSGSATITVLDLIATLSDDCTDSTGIVLSSLSQSVFSCSDVDLSPIEVSFTATDSCGNPTTATANVTVLDGVSQSVSCPGNVTVNNDAGTCGAILSFGYPTTSDNCGIDSIYWIMTGDSVDASPRTVAIDSIADYPFPVGTTTVTYWVKDHSNNGVSCSFDVTVIDAEAPGATWPGDIAHIAYQERIGYEITIPELDDNCGVTNYSFTVELAGGAGTVGPYADGTDFTNGDPSLFTLPDLEVGDNIIHFSFSDGVNNGTHDWTIHVDRRPAILPNYNVDPLCVGNDNGEIHLTRDIEYENSLVREMDAVGDGSFTVIPSLNNIYNLTAGTYYFRVSTVIDDDGTPYTSYSDTVSVTLTDPPTFVISPADVSSITPETCDSENDGEIHISIDYDDGIKVPPFRQYTVSWTKDGALYDTYLTDGFADTDSVNLKNLDNGVYELSVIDTENCPASESYTVTIDNDFYPTISVAATSVTFPDPDGLVDGRVILTVDPLRCDRTIVPGDALDPSADDFGCPDYVFVHDYALAPDPTTLVGAVFEVDTFTITWTVTDATGNTADTTYNIIIQDNIFPEITVVPNTTYPYCDSLFSIPLPTVSDICGIDSVICSLTGTTNWKEGIDNGETETTEIDFTSIGSTTVTWTVRDVNGNKSSASYDIGFTTPIDTTSGFFVNHETCYGDTDGIIHLEFSGGTPNYNVSIGGVYSVTNSALTTHEITSVLPSAYTITITDADGCPFILDTVVNEPAPIDISITSQINNDCFENTDGVLDLTVTGGNGGYSYAWTGPTYNYADAHPWAAEPVFSFADYEDQSGMPTGSYGLTVTDVNSCSQVASFEILSNDVTRPPFSFAADLTVDLPNGSCDYTVSGGEFDPTVTDLDGCTNRIWNDLNSTGTLDGELLGVGAHAVTWHIYDLSGNGKDTVVNYTIVDNEFPQFNSPPEPLNVNVALGDCDYTLQAVDYAMVYSDNCGVPTLTYERSDNPLLTLSDPFEVRNEADTIFWTLTDAAGLSVTYKQVIKVSDNTPPDIDCSTALNVYLRSNPSNPNYTLTVADYEDLITDNCIQFDTIYANRNDVADSRTFGCNDVSISPISVRITATDIWTNTNFCDVDVNVLDTVSPVASTTAKTIFLDASGNANLDPKILNNNSYDNCTPAASLVYTVDPADSTYDCSDAGMVHSVVLHITDASGNTKNKSVNVTVQDTLAPTITPLGSTPVVYLNSAGTYTVDGKTLINTVNDNCSPYADINVSSMPSVVTCDSVGFTSVLLTADDAYGNSVNQRINVEVRDTIDPTPVLANRIVRLGTSATADTTIDASIFDNGSFDNCGNLTFTASVTYFSCGDIGDHLIDVTVDDGNGNTITETVTLTITAPIEISSVNLNACASTSFFTAEVIPAPDDLNDYEWHWWASASNNGSPNRDVLCSDEARTICGGESYEPTPYYDPSHNVEYWIHLVVNPVGSACASDTFRYFMDVSNQGGATSNDILEEVDVCLDEVETYIVTDIDGTATAEWSIQGVNGVGIIIGSDNDVSDNIVQATVAWGVLTSDYDTDDYLQLVVTYPSGGGKNGKACSDIYKWYPWVHDAPNPQFTVVAATEACPNDTVTYTLDDTYVSYAWDGITAGKFVAGGNNTSNYVTVVWDGALGASDSIKVTVYNSTGCYDSVWTSAITITDVDPPVFLSDASTFSRTMKTQIGRCDTILAGMPWPVVQDECNGDFCSNCVGLTRTYEIRNSVTSALLFSGDSTNFRSRRLPVGVWDVEWFAEDAGGNANTTAFTYTITVVDQQFPQFTTTPTSFFADSDLDACTYTHDNATEDWNLTATDYCGVDLIWCKIGTDSLTAADNYVDGYEFSNSVTPVTWYVRDVNNNVTSHTYNVLLNDVNYPTFRFGSMPADVGVFGDPGFINYEGTLAENARFYVFENDITETFPLTIQAIITDFCNMGPVTVTLTDPDATVRGPFTVTAVDDTIFNFTGDINLGRTTIRWDYEDASGNSKTLQHRVVFASTYGFDCVAPADMWGAPTDHMCNPETADFNQGSGTASLPDWFNALRSLNILSYTLSFTSTLDPTPTLIDGCKYSRDKQFNGLYKITISGNSTSQLEPEVNCAQSFTYYIDEDGPVVDETNKKDLTLTCDGADHSAEIAAWLADTALVQTADITDGCTASEYITMTYNYTLGGTTCGVGSITPVTFYLQDSCLNTTTFTANIIFIDTIAPTFTYASTGLPRSDDEMPQDYLVSEGNSMSCDAVDAYLALSMDVGSEDDCDATPTVTKYVTSTKNANLISGDADDNNYTITRRWEATDVCGNPRNWIQTIEVRDLALPYIMEDESLQAPTPLVIDCGPVPAKATFTFADNCDLSVNKVTNQVSTKSTDPATAAYYNYVVTNTWTGTDNVGNSYTYVQNITVQDTMVPVITVAARDTVVECNGTGNTTAYNNWLTNKAKAVATDCANQANLIWTNNAATEAWVTLCGSSKYKLVTFTVTDPSGNFSTTQATFTIDDNTIPAISDSLATIGPYGSEALVPAAYTTIAELRAAYPTINFTDNCDTDQNNLSIDGFLETDNKTTSSCTYTITRYYRVIDQCGNVSKTFTQKITVNDGVDPEILKDPVPPYNDCAEEPINQSTLISGLALTASDISDNCNPDPATYLTSGDWFIANVATGAIKYMIINNDDASKNVPLQNGNLDSHTFYEGENEVYYQVTDANGNSSDLILLYKITVLRMPVISDITTAELEGIVGGANNPLQYSTHSYSITMLDYGTNWGNGSTGWEIYPAGDWSTPETDYSIYYSNSGNDVTAEITFGNLATGNYDLVFTEEDLSNCTAQKSYSITVGAAFDVDIDEVANQCPTDDNAILNVGSQVDADGTGRTTSITYTINMMSSYESNWQFNYDVTIAEDGGGGTDASVNSISFDDGAKGNILVTPASSSSGTVNVTYNSGDPTVVIGMTVVYNDIHGTTQAVKVALSDITGSSQEVDLNVELSSEGDDVVGLDGNSDQNEVEHLIQDLPIPGNIIGVE